MTYNNLRSKLHAIVLVATCLITLSCGGLGGNEEEMMDRARDHMAEKKINAAILELKNLLQKNAAHGEARYMLARLSMMLGDLKTSEKEVRRALDVGWNEAESRLLQAEILLGLQEYDKLREIAIRDHYPTAIKANLTGLLAAAALAEGDLDDARETLELGASIDGDARWIQNSGIRLHMLEEDLDSSKAGVERALELYPDDQDFWLMQAAVAERMEDRELADSSLRKVLELDPPKVMTMRGRQASISLVQFSLAENDFDSAREMLKPVLRYYAGDPVAHYFAGLMAYAEKDYDVAVEHLTRVLKLSPDHRESLQLMGNINYAQKDFQQAAYYLEKATSVTPGNMTAQAMLGKTYMALGQYRDAEERLQYISTRVKENPSITALIGISRLQGGDADAGIAELEKASMLNPDDVNIRQELARAYVLRGETRSAIDSLETMLSDDANRDHHRARAILILAHLQDSNFEEALKMSEEMIEQLPGVTLPVNLAGSAHEGMRAFDAARAKYDQALEIDSSDVLAQLSLARLDMLDGKSDAAAERYQSILKKYPELSAALVGMARILVLRGDDEDAIEMLEKARETNERDVESRLLLANYYLTLSRPQIALKYTEEALAINDRDLRLHAVRMAARVDSRHPDAGASIEQMLAARPDLAYTHYYLAKHRLSGGDAEGARSALQKAIELSPNYLDALVAMSNMERLYGNIDKSMEIARSLREKYSTSTSGYLLEADALLALKKPGEAISVLTSAMAFAADGEVVIRINKIQQSLGNHEKGYAVLNDWIDSHPEDIAVRFNLAVSYMARKDYEQAIKAYEGILEVRPNIPAVMNDLAWLYSETGKAGALDMARRAHKLVPDNPAIQDTYGWLLMQSGRTANALVMLEEAASKAPSTYDIQYHYAYALHQNGDSDKAKALLEKILAVDTTFSERAEAEKLLKSM